MSIIRSGENIAQEESITIIRRLRSRTYSSCPSVIGQSSDPLSPCPDPRTGTGYFPASNNRTMDFQCIPQDGDNPAQAIRVYVPLPI